MILIQSTTVRGPYVATDGLLAYFDAGNTASYPGSGTTWYDISGNKRNATLVNSPTFNSANNGTLVFSDGTYQHATFATPGNLSVWTVDCWFKTAKSFTGKVTSLITNEYDLASKLNVSLGTNYAPNNYQLQAGFFNGAWRTTTSGVTPTIGVWYYLTGTYDGTTIRLYSNGVEVSNVVYSGTPQSGGNYRIARRWDASATDSANYFDGSISVVRLYNRALSAPEVLRNFESMRSRFGI